MVVDTIGPEIQFRILTTERPCLKSISKPVRANYHVFSLIPVFIKVQSIKWADCSHIPQQQRKRVKYAGIDIIISTVSQTESQSCIIVQEPQVKSSQTWVESDKTSYTFCTCFLLISFPPSSDAGSPLPQSTKDTLRIYSMRFCPFSQRTRMVLAHKLP